MDSLTYLELPRKGAHVAKSTAWRIVGRPRRVDGPLRRDTTQSGRERKAQRPEPENRQFWLSALVSELSTVEWSCSGRTDQADMGLSWAFAIEGQCPDKTLHDQAVPRG